MEDASRDSVNRQNALRSTGPRTPTGKAISSKNALKHGLLSQEVLLPGDDQDAFQRLRRCLRAALAPSGDLEVLLADWLVALAWRLRRALVIEREMMAADLDERLRWWKMLDDENGAKPTLGQAVGHNLRGDDGLGKMMRYEAHLGRTFYRALHELQRLQAVRSGAAVPPPAALHLDVDVTGDAGMQGSSAGL